MNYEEYVISDRLSLLDARERLAKLFVEIGAEMSYISELERNIMSMELKIKQEQNSGRVQ